ncbi:hypothetical protein EX30DRAFT_328839 [Ascodesmis nigricans]|uniref:U6 small nuclear RNA (adenine-(43)-N(6))-methyltransferase n=1 Tax=Ascodesmis nigricans TaxID=341454 RepID=A0A4S2N1J1_9PEZI|nr:hypothetical protein EX30DRAFT_328839 [Ascodesmis nigricans]
MHPRSPFNSPTLFAELAREYPDLAKHVIPPSSLNFKDPEAVQALSRCLLQHHFSLDVELRGDRLCPMIPNRVDYILWLQDLLDETAPNSPKDRKIIGLDIGTGASAVYPLLGCALRETWSMIGTDIDSVSLETACRNCEKNQKIVGDRITIHKSSVDGALIPLDALNLERIDFVMCNPPFYSSATDMLQSAEAKLLPPLTACTGTPTEMVHAPDGELGFARKMLEESRQLGERVQWYTTLFGKLSSVQEMVREIGAVLGGSGNWAVTQFVQGTTRRWAVGWSFGDLRARRGTVLVESVALAGCCPFPPEVTIRAGEKVQREKVREVLRELKTLNTVDPREMYCEFAGNVWSRAWRRASLRGTATTDGKLRLGVHVELLEGNQELEIRWVRGLDKVLFESFCEMMRRKFAYS